MHVYFTNPTKLSFPRCLLVLVSPALQHIVSAVCERAPLMRVDAGAVGGCGVSPGPFTRYRLEFEKSDAAEWGMEMLVEMLMG